MRKHEDVSLGPQHLQNKPGEAVYTCNAMVGTKRQADLWRFTIGQWRLHWGLQASERLSQKQGEGCTALKVGDLWPLHVPAHRKKL